MHRSTVECALAYEVQSPTHLCFHIEAAHWPAQLIEREVLAVSSGVSPHRFVDAATGNRFFRFDASPGPLLVNYSAEVAVRHESIEDDLPQVPLVQIPDEVLRYLMPSRYCQSDLLAKEAMDRFGDAPSGLARVRRVVRWIHDHIEYAPGSSMSSTTAQEVLALRKGGGPHFAHPGIRFFRALNIPARLVSGYVWFDVPPQDFHAVFEAWLGGRWVLFDPTGMAPVDRVVRIGTGSDAGDVAFSTFFGQVVMTRKWVDTTEHDPRGRPPSGEPALALAAAPSGG